MAKSGQITLGDVRDGLSTEQLAAIFSMSVTVARSRLAGCQPMNNSVTRRRYSLKEAARFLCDPVFDVEEVVKRMKPKDLPNHLNDAFWSAKLKEQRWQTEARQLFYAEDVRDVLADSFKAVRDTLKLVPDQVEASCGLTEAQRKMMTEELDKAQMTMVDALKGLDLKTYSSIREELQQPEDEEDDLADAI